jgi:hypothetical protein
VKHFVKQWKSNQGASAARCFQTTVKKHSGASNVIARENNCEGDEALAAKQLEICLEKANRRLTAI